MTATLSNPAAVTAREQRRADRERFRAALAAREAAEQAWDTPVPYVPTPAAASALSPNEQFDPDSTEWQAILSPSLTTSLSPVALHALSAAVKSATAPATANTPVLEVARVTLTDGAVTIMSTDRYRVHRLTVPAEGAVHAEGYVTPKDLAAVVRALAPAAARRGTTGTLPIIRVTVDPDEHTITWETPDARHTTPWGDMIDYPPVERFLSPDEQRAPVDAWHVNPAYLGDALTAAAVVADANTPARVSADAPADAQGAAMIRVSAGDAAAPAGLFDACIMSVRW